MAEFRWSQTSQQSEPGPEHRALDVFIGKWINEGETVAGDAAPAMKILTSDVYEWMPGGFFVLHTAYGTVGGTGVGGTEIIGWDPEARVYRSQFFDSQGGVSMHELTLRDGLWTWQGEATRCEATFSDDGRVQTAHHQRSQGSGWVPSMEVVLTRVAP